MQSALLIVLLTFVTPVTPDTEQESELKDAQYMSNNPFIKKTPTSSNSDVLNIKFTNGKTVKDRLEIVAFGKGYKKEDVEALIKDFHNYNTSLQQSLSKEEKLRSVSEQQLNSLLYSDSGKDWAVSDAAQSIIEDAKKKAQQILSDAYSEADEIKAQTYLRREKLEEVYQQKFAEQDHELDKVRAEHEEGKERDLQAHRENIERISLEAEQSADEAKQSADRYVAEKYERMEERLSETLSMNRKLMEALTRSETEISNMLRTSRPGADNFSNEEVSSIS